MSASPGRKRVAALISGRGSNVASLIEAARNPGYPAEIALVLSNRPDAGGLARAAEGGITTEVVDHKVFGSRESFEAELDRVIRSHRIDIVALAGFMRVLTPSFVERWTGCMLNIHPSLLPSFKGLHTHARALAEGVRIHGCTVHFVVPELDSGPIVAQAAVPVHGTESEGELAARVLAQEHVIYPRALAWLAEGRVRLEGGRVAFDGGAADGALVSPGG